MTVHVSILDECDACVLSFIHQHPTICTISSKLGCFGEDFVLWIDIASSPIVGNLVYKPFKGFLPVIFDNPLNVCNDETPRQILLQERCHEKETFTRHRANQRPFYTISLANGRTMSLMWTPTSFSETAVFLKIGGNSDNFSISSSGT